METAQTTTGITFAVDAVEPATKRLAEESLAESLGRRSGREFVSLPGKDQRVVANASFHPLIEAIHRAFADHRPLILSPDDIWLTIQQGFAHHVNENAEALRHTLVSHDGKRELVVEVESFPTDETWPDAIALWSASVREYVDPQLHAALVCNFSTTTPAIRTASEVALLDAFQRYFDYVLLCVCGIPQVTLRGTVNDWKKIRQHVELLEPYALDWWVARLRPILDQLVETAEGTPDTAFWQAIYKPGIAYGSEVATGWITDLFPYLKRDSATVRNETLEHPRESWALLRGRFNHDGVAPHAFPSGLSCAPIQLRHNNLCLELVAGFLGVTQDTETNEISPLIGWSVCQPDQIDAFWNRCAQRFPQLVPPKDERRSYRDIPAVLVALQNSYGELYFFPNTKNEWIITTKLHDAKIPEDTLFQIPSEAIFAYGLENQVLTVNLFRHSHRDTQWLQRVSLSRLVKNSQVEELQNGHTLTWLTYEFYDQQELEGDVIAVLERLIAAEGDSSKL